uniref:Nitroreductase domain-containing protein n=1 Tax=Peronospora matthiolae TaxID=2874970 RepID=A0AAV1UMU3_9STRA
MATWMTLAVASSATSVGLALYVLHLRASLREAATRNDTLWTAEDLVAARRSIFPMDYDHDRRVPRAVLDKMLEGANWAPTHGRTEPWRFVVFASLPKRQELGEFLASVYRTTVPSQKVLDSKYRKLVNNCTTSSYVVAICLKRQKSRKIPEWEELCAVACAVQNMHLVATAHGVGAYWSSGAISTESQEMKEYLQLSEADKCLGLFYVGAPNPRAVIAKGVRKPIEEKVSWRE